MGEEFEVRDSTQHEGCVVVGTDKHTDRSESSGGGVGTRITFEDVSDRYVDTAARRVATQYGRYLVTFEDCKQEIYLWLYSQAGQRYVNQRLRKEKQQTTRIRYKLQSVAKTYAEKMKAEKVGYDPDDVHWYSTTQIVALMPLVLDDTFDGNGVPDYDTERVTDNGPRAKKNPAELGDLNAMVMDVRMAISKLPAEAELILLDSEPSEPAYDSVIENILNILGGPKDYVGRRRVMSNAEGQARVNDGQ